MYIIIIIEIIYFINFGVWIHRLLWSIIIFVKVRNEYNSKRQVSPDYRIIII
jgi:hypothetical protein